MKIQLLSAMYGRHKAVSIALDSWLSEGLDPVMVVSKKSDADYCRQRHIQWTWCDNTPLAKKWQHGVDYVKKNYEADALLMLGSDDVIEGAKNYLKYLEQGYEFIGIKDVYFKELNTGRVKHWQGYTNHRRGESAGAGRCFSKELLDRIDWKFWNVDIEKGLDGHLTNKLKTIEHKSILIDSSEVKITDLKDENSLTPFHRFNLPIVNE